MKHSLLFALLLATVSLPAQLPDSLLACVDSALSHAQRFAIRRNHLNWEPLRDTLLQKVATAQTPLDLRPGFRYLLEALHDSHGRFLLQGKPIAWYHGKPEPYQQSIDPKVWAMIQSGKHPFQSALLDGETAYLRIVAMPTGDNRRLAAPIQDTICSFLRRGAKYWVLDLRYNGGGNMHAMLGALGNLLGDGEVGGSMDGDGNRFSTWTIKDGDVYYDDFLSNQMEDKCLLPELPKVAVLTSRYTVSAGEVVAVAFKGRPNTRFFGEHTAGFTTETHWQVLPAGVTMSVAASYYADRQGRVYKTFVDVDEPFDFVPDAAPDNDPALRRAVEWLRKK
ncbi:MAG: hypothetical protein IT260_13650 [Saprospiraceae bacterium]|nr:hypothetical protein [Saprospiraceae bacterium]